MYYLGDVDDGGVGMGWYVDMWDDMSWVVVFDVLYVQEVVYAWMVDLLGIVDG